MKRIGLVSFALVNLMFLQTINAQTFTDAQKSTIAEVKKQMDNDQRQSMDDANNLFEEANYILENVDKQDVELEKAFEKGSTPKAEKKAVNVKVQRIEANRQYSNAYNMIFDALSAKINALPFAFPEDKTKAEELILAGKTKVTDATALMDNYRFLDDKDLQTYKYADLQDQIKNSQKAFEDAISLECDAANLFLNQESKKSTMSDEDVAWGVATTNNSYDSFAEYLTKYPNGKNADNARQNQFMIDPDRYNAENNASTKSDVPAGVVVENSSSNNSSTTNSNEPVVEGVVSNNVISGVATNNAVAEPTKEEPVYSEPIVEKVEEKIQEAVEPVYSQPVVEETVYSEPIVEKQVAAVKEKVAPTQPKQTATPANVTESSPAGIIYRVQIIALARGEISNEELQAIYSGNEPIHKRVEDGFYKYCIGEFTSLADANNLRKSLSTDAFVVKFQDGKKVN